MSDIPNIYSLQQERRNRDKLKSDIYSIVLNKCIEKVVYTNRHTDKSFVIFEVPKILIGYPSYDMQHCLLYLMEKLSEQDYIVEFMEPFYLYIDWGRTASKKGSSSKFYSDKFGNIPTIDPDRLKKETRKLLQKFPDTHKVEFVYEDTINSKNKSKKKK
jgi:hypothetical protein